jgi:hypothetical protein
MSQLTKPAAKQPFKWTKFRRQRCKSENFISFNGVSKDIRDHNKFVLAEVLKQQQHQVRRGSTRDR